MCRSHHPGCVFNPRCISLSDTYFDNENLKSQENFPNDKNRGIVPDPAGFVLTGSGGYDVRRSVF